MYGLLSVKRSIWTERAGTDDSRGGGMGGGGRVLFCFIEWHGDYGY